MRPFLVDLSGKGFGQITTGYCLSEISRILKVRPIDSACIDVGANIGVWSRYMSNHIPSGMVYAIESSPSNFRLLRLNCDGYHNIICSSYAIGEKSGKVEFNEAAEPGLRHLSTDSLASQGIIEVEAIRLDDWASGVNLSRLDFIKIDVEGFEEEVVMSSKNTLQRLLPIVCFEFILSMARLRSAYKGCVLFDLWQDLGYRVFRLDKAGFMYDFRHESRDWTNDYIAVPKGSTVQLPIVN